MNKPAKCFLSSLTFKFSKCCIFISVLVLIANVFGNVKIYQHFTDADVVYKKDSDLAQRHLIGS